MKIGQSPSFQKLISGKVDAEQNQNSTDSKKAAPRESSAVTQNLKGSVESNEQAASALRSVEVVSSTKVEVQEEVQRASKSTPEDVEKIADLVSRDIKRNPDKAIEAQANQSSSRVSELLR